MHCLVLDLFCLTEVECLKKFQSIEIMHLVIEFSLISIRIIEYVEADYCFVFKEARPPKDRRNISHNDPAPYNPFLSILRWIKYGKVFRVFFYPGRNILHY